MNNVLVNKVEKDVIIWDGSDIDFESKCYNFPYKIDKFQKSAMFAIKKGDNVMVTAHTGAGKTAIALFAIKNTLNTGKYCLYISPIKTLSNQKYHDFCNDKQLDDIGILTGDIKENIDAPVVIMTAEILRNSLRQINSDNKKQWDYKIDIDKIGCVIIDEVHYIMDPDRGKVWEEIIFKLPKNIQLVMLSATVNGAEKFSNWVYQLKNKPVHLISTPFRPVPLKHFIFWDDNIHLFLEGDDNWNSTKWDEIYNKWKKVSKTMKKPSTTTLYKCINFIKNKKRLPATVFVLNRKHVEQWAEKLPISFADHNDISEIKKIWNKYLIKYREEYQTTHQWNFLFQLVQKGIGIHHSGLIPILKEIVEILYSKGLLKVLFATETFSVGVNMPTKTTIFTSVKKWDGNGNRFLRRDEYIQMAGRAGRRGLDTYGEVVLCPVFDIPNNMEAKNMCVGKSRVMTSKLSIDWDFILKLTSLYWSENKVHNLNRSENKVNNLNRSQNSEKEHEETFIDFLLESVKESFLSMENNSRINYLKKEIDKIQIDYDELSLKNEEKKNFIFKFRNETELKNTLFCVSKKNKKKINKINKDLDKIKYSKFCRIFKNLNLLKNEYELENNKFKTQIIQIVDFLQTNKYLTEDNRLTTLGILASNINECNPIILSQAIENKIFNNMEFSNIVALISVFIKDNSVKSPYLSDLDIDDNLRDKLEQIGEISNTWADKEWNMVNSLPICSTSDWNLYLALFTGSKLWAEGKQWNEIYQTYDTFEGNFIKNIIRITHILRNLEWVAKINNNSNLLNILENYEEKLIRNIVTTDSLYV